MATINKDHSHDLDILSSYTDAARAGIKKILDVCHVATVAEVQLHNGDQASELLIDGVAVLPGQRVLVKNQPSRESNGIYTRSLNAPLEWALDAGLIFPAVVSIERGARNAGTLWVITETNIIPLDMFLTTSAAAKPFVNEASQFVRSGPDEVSVSVYTGSIAAGENLVVSGTAVMNEVIVKEKLTFGHCTDDIDIEDAPRFAITNGTLHDCQEHGLLLKLYSLAAIADDAKSNKNGSSGRNVLTTVSRAIAYNRVSWTVDGVTYATNMLATFTGYIRPAYVETSLLYLTIAGSAQLWIDGSLIADIATETRETLTCQYAFKKKGHVPFVLHYRPNDGASDATSVSASALKLEWSFSSAPVREIVESRYFACSGAESGPVLLGPIRAHGEGIFHSAMCFERDVSHLGNLTVNGAINCTKLRGQYEESLQFGQNGTHLISHGLTLESNKAAIDPVLRVVSADGSYVSLGRKEDHVTLTSGGGVSPLQFVVGNTPVSTMRETSMAVSVPLLANSGLTVKGGDLSVTGDIITSGHIRQSGKVHVGTSSGNYPEKLSVVGDNGSHLSGPHLATYTSLDTRPLFQLSSFSHDNIGLNFDSSYDGATLTPSSTNAAQILKTAKQLSVNYYSPVSGRWSSAWSIDLDDGNTLFAGKGSVFSHDDSNGTGSIRIAPHVSGGNTSIAFYNTINMRTALIDDCFRLGYIDGAFSLKAGTGTCNLLSIQSNGDTVVKGKFEAGGNTRLSDVAIDGALTVNGSGAIRTLIVDVDSDANASEPALQVMSSARISKNLAVGGKVLTGRLHISSKLPRINFSSANTENAIGTPKLGETTQGTRIVLAKAEFPDHTDMAIGTSRRSLWHAVPQATGQFSHQWFAGEQRLMSLSGLGNLTLESQGGDVDFRNIASLSINGSGPKASAVLNIGQHWSIRSNRDTFVLTEAHGKGIEPNLELPIMRVERDHSTGSVNMSLPLVETLEVDHGLIKAREAFFSGEIAASNIQIHENDNGLAEVVFADRFRLTSTNSSSRLTSVNDMHFTCQTGSVFHRGCPVNFEVYHDESSRLLINSEGCRLSGNVLVKQGGLTVLEGGLNILDKASVSTFRGPIDVAGLHVHGKVGISLTSHEQSDQTAIVKYQDKIFLLYSATRMVIRSGGGITMDPGKGDVRVAGTIRVKDVTLNEKGLMLKAIGDGGDDRDDRDGGSGKIGSAASYSLTTLLKSNLWYYIGQINTTPRGSAPDETGSMHVTLTDSGREIVVWLKIEKGGEVNVSHSIVGPHDYLTECSRLVVYKDNSDGTHVYVKVSSLVLATNLTIQSSVFAHTPACTSEGSGDIPDGKESMFSHSSFSCIWDSQNSPPATLCAYYGSGQFSQSIESRGSLKASGATFLDGGVYTDIIDSTPGNGDGDENGTVQILARKKRYLVIGQDRITVSSPLVPDATQLDLGSVKLPFQNGYFSGILSASHRMETHKLFVANDALIEGKLDLTGALRVHEGTASFHSVDVADQIVINGNLICARANVYNLACSVVHVDDNITLAGPIVLHGDNAAIVAANELKTVPVYATDICLQETRAGTAALRIAADGTVRASKHLHLSCGSGHDILVGDAACQSIHASCDIFTVDQQLSVEGPTRFSSEVSVSGKSVFNETVAINSTLFLGVSETGTGEVAVTTAPGIALSDSSYPMLQWNLGDMLTLHVPGSQSGKMNLTENGIQLDGDVDCSTGNGTFATVTSKLVQSSVVVADKFVLGEGSSLLSDNGFIYLEVGANADGKGQTIKAIEISSESARAVFAGDIVSKGNAAASSLQVGEKVSISNDGKLQFSSANHKERNGAEIKLVPKSGLSPETFVFRHPGGGLAFQAAKNRGFSVAPISGNATFQGQVVVESGLDVDTSNSSDVATAALQVNGGIIVKRSILVEGSLQLSNDSHARFSILAPTVSPNSAAGYTLRLPNTLPSGPGYCLVGNANGQLSWKAFTATPTAADETGAYDPERLRMYQRSELTFSAGNNVVNDIVDGFVATGRSFHIPHFVVTVTRIDGLSNLVASYDIRGVRSSDDWVAKIKKKLGSDEIDIRLSLLSDGRLCYTTQYIPSWKSTLFTWMAAESQATLQKGRSVLGHDTVISSLSHDNKGAFLSVGSASCTRDSDVHNFPSWAGTHFGRPTLTDNAICTADASVDAITAYAATVTIEDAPKWNATNAPTYALYIANGETRLGGRLSAEQGIVASSVDATGPVSLNDTFQLGGGSELHIMQKGLLHIGPSAQKCVTVDIEFTTPMSDTAYCILGNVVSADPDSSDAFACTFKKLTRSGCKVTVCNIMADAWSDVTVRVHWFATL